MSLQGKSIIVTGAGGVIGKYIALALAQEGASVVLASRTASSLKDTENWIRDRLGRDVPLLSVSCDVESDSSVKAMVEKTEATFGSVYGLICSAGIYGAMGAFADLPLEEWSKGLNTNLYGTLRCIHAVLPGMRKRGEGRIVLFSGGGQGAMPRFSSYVAGKGAIWRLTETLGAEFAEYGILLNAMAPGPVKSKLLDELIAAGPGKVGQARYEQALKQQGEDGPPPEKAGELAVYLMSDASKGMHGKLLSALYDRYREIPDPKALNGTDVFTMRRVVSPDGATRY